MIARQRKLNLPKKGPEIEFASKHKKCLNQSPYSPLPVGVVEEDTLSDATYDPATLDSATQKNKDIYASSARQ